MASAPQDSGQPIQINDFKQYFPFALAEEEDRLQLQADVANVYENRVDINTFPPEYQKLIKDYYRFSAIRQNSKSHNIATRNRSTLDII